MGVLLNVTLYFSCSRLFYVTNAYVLLSCWSALILFLFSEDGLETFVTGSHDQLLHVWHWSPDENSVKCLYKCAGHGFSVEAVTASPDRLQVFYQLYWNCGHKPKVTRFLMACHGCFLEVSMWGLVYPFATESGGFLSMWSKFMEV